MWRWWKCKNIWEKTFPGAGSPECKALGLKLAYSIGGTAKNHTVWTEQEKE